MQKLNNDKIKSFDELYKNCQARFVRFANSYVKDIVIAEDITTEAIIYYWEHRALLTEESNTLAYILTIIKNKCLNHLRHLHICEEYNEQVRSFNEWELNMRIATLEACEPYELFATEIHLLVKQTLDKLPERTRQVFILSRFKNKSYKEIAELMHISTKGVDFHIGKALKALRESLKDYFPLFLYFLLKIH